MSHRSISLPGSSFAGRANCGHAKAFGRFTKPASFLRAFAILIIKPSSFFWRAPGWRAAAERFFETALPDD
jgi:hypothetical protein